MFYRLYKIRQLLEMVVKLDITLGANRMLMRIENGFIKYVNTEQNAASSHLTCSIYKIRWLRELEFLRRLIIGGYNLKKLDMQMTQKNKEIRKIQDQNSKCSDTYRRRSKEVRR